MIEDTGAAKAKSATDAENVSIDTSINDNFLAQLVLLANQFDIEQGITLSLGGGIITGQLISGKRYFEQMSSAALSAKVTGIPEFENIRSTFADIFKLWSSLYEYPENTPDDWSPTMPAFIHLLNAKWIYPNGSVNPGNTGVLWRGKLSAVDGFSLGEITRADATRKPATRLFELAAHD